MLGVKKPCMNGKLHSREEGRIFMIDYEVQYWANCALTRTGDIFPNKVMDTELGWVKPLLSIRVRMNTLNSIYR